MTRPLAVDVAMVGGGPAGATLAVLLASHGISALVADVGERRGPTVEVLPPTAVRIVADLGLLAELDRDDALAQACLGVVRRWGAVEERHDFLSDHGGRGWIIDRVRFDERVADRARTAGATWWSHTRLERIARVRGLWDLSFRAPEGTRNARARFLVDASGRARTVAHRLGVVIQRSSPLIATWTRAGAAQNESSASWLNVSAHPAWWAYSVGGPRGQSVDVLLSLGAPPHNVRSSRRISACNQILSMCAGDDWAAVGDAAAAFDPITSQGLTNALASAAALVPAIEAALTRQAAADVALRRYDAAMRATFRNAELGTREVYTTALRSLGGAFWERMARGDERQGAGAYG